MPDSVYVGGRRGSKGGYKNRSKVKGPSKESIPWSDAQYLMEQKIAIERKEMEIELMKVYDADGNGHLDMDELKHMLAEHSVKKDGIEYKPTEDDIDFILALCGKKEEDANSAGKEVNLAGKEYEHMAVCVDDYVDGPPAAAMVDKAYVMKVVDVWAEFLKEQGRIKELMAEFDADGNGSIEKEELQFMLDGINGYKPVDPKVTDWVMEQADIVKDGSLGEMELVRAVCAFDKWRGTTQSIVVEDVKVCETLPKPKQQKQACCTIS
jgi:Ca2+-binding EF-hand superfamily protein